MSEILAVEREYMARNHEQLAKDYPNSFVVIQGTEVYGSREDFEEAVEIGAQKFTGGYLVRHVNNPDGPSVTIGPLGTGIVMMSPLVPEGGASQS